VSTGVPQQIHDVEVITFDFYAALMDTVRSLKESAATILAADPSTQTLSRADSDGFVSSWAGRYSGYVGVVNALQQNEDLEWADKDLFRMMLNITLEHSCRLKKLPLQWETKRSLIESWKHLQPWSNTSETLRRLAAARRPDGSRRFKLVALSNADTEFLAAGCKVLEREAEFTFDAYLGCNGLGVGGVCLFKPAPGFYAQVRKLLPGSSEGDWKKKVLHVAGAEYDANGAKAFGFYTAWNANSTDPIFFDYTGTGRNVPDVILTEIGELPGALGLPRASERPSPAAARLI